MRQKRQLRRTQVFHFPQYPIDYFECILLKKTTPKERASSTTAIVSMAAILRKMQNEYTSKNRAGESGNCLRIRIFDRARADWNE